MEKTNKVERSELWNEIYNIVKQIPRKDVDDDAVDASSATTSIEEMLIKIKNRRETKIEAAIRDTKLRLKNAEQEIMLMIREKDTLKKQLDTLETIFDSKHLS
jgi:hypothetical protein